MSLSVDATDEASEIRGKKSCAGTQLRPPAVGNPWEVRRRSGFRLDVHRVVYHPLAVEEPEIVAASVLFVSSACPFSFLGIQGPFGG